MSLMMLRRLFGYEEDESAPEIKLSPEVSPIPPVPEKPIPEIRQPVREIIRRMLEERPEHSEDSVYGGYVTQYISRAAVGAVQIMSSVTFGGYCGPTYKAELAYGEHQYQVREHEAKAIYEAFVELRSMDHVDRQMAAKDAICDYLGVSTTQPQ